MYHCWLFRCLRVQECMRAAFRNIARVCVERSRSSWMCCKPGSEKSLPTHNSLPQNYHFVVEYMLASLMPLNVCLSLNACVCLHASQGSQTSSTSAACPWFGWRAALLFVLKKSFSYFVTLSCKMSLLKSVPGLWLPSSIGILPSAGSVQAGNCIWMSESCFNICLEIVLKIYSSSFSQNRRLQQWWVSYSLSSWTR